MSAEIAAGPVLPSTMWQRCASPHTSRTICKRFDQTAPPRVVAAGSARSRSRPPCTPPAHRARRSRACPCHRGLFLCVVVLVQSTRVELHLVRTSPIYACHRSLVATMPIETALQHIRRSRWPNELSHNVISRREKSGIGTDGRLSRCPPWTERNARRDKIGCSSSSRRDRWQPTELMSWVAAFVPSLPPKTSRSRCPNARRRSCRRLYDGHWKTCSRDASCHPRVRP